jgi:CheY-like chemotaxis protein
MTGAVASGRVLIVDDDQDLAEVVRDVLRGVGFDSSVVHNGHEALELLRYDRRFGLVLLDLMMPVMNGWQFRTRQLADPTLSDIPVVTFSGGVNCDEVADVLGAAGCLHKPVSRQDLLALVRRVCRREESQ